jgi:WD40 repeat protein
MDTLSSMLLLSTTTSTTTTSYPTSSSMMTRLPLELLFDHVCPYLDRCTLNHVMLVCRQAYQCLMSDDRPSPPWPKKLVSHDHMCRIRSMVFSPDGTELACGCFDGSIKIWHVWTGEQKHQSSSSSSSSLCHWPGEAVVALAYSNHDNGRSAMLVSSSTDHTIRLWKKRNIQHRPKGPWGDINNNNNNSNSSCNSSTIRKNITIQIRDAGHAYALMFSPDNTYLVSGHHPQTQQPLNNPNHRRQDDWNDGQLPLQQQQRSLYPIPETIYLWSVATGLKIRRLENGGMPIGFVRSMGESTFTLPEHRLLTTCAGECLKLWSLNGKTNHSHNNSNNNNISSTSSTCLQRFFLDGYTTVMPIPTPTVTNMDKKNKSTNNNIHTEIDIMVASIDGNDSFTVWNTGRTDNNNNNSSNKKNGYKVFANASPYEIKFTTNCTKVASVDNFTQVKVWDVQSGKLLKSFVQENNNINNSDGGGISRSSVQSSTSLSSSSSSPSRRCHGGFPIHELAFCQDSTVAVVSRFHNEILLFST